jgi:hypothetical protein
MRKTVLLLASVVVAMLLANLFGCGQTSPPREVREQNASAKNNEGLSREEEKELSQRLEELEKRVEAQEKAVTQETANHPKENSQTEQQQAAEERSSPEGQTKAELVQAVEDYYQAADRDDWAYTYGHLDSQTQAMFTEEEWYMKNQWFADTYPAPLSDLNVQVNGSPSDPVVSVTVYRGFTDGTSQTRNTYFLIEDGVWKHRFGAEEIDLFMPEASYEEFVAVQQGSSLSSASASASTSASVGSASASVSALAGPAGGGVQPISEENCPPSAPIKGNDSSSGELIYHTRSSATYDDTYPEECFATEAAAQAAGYRAARD